MNGGGQTGEEMVENLYTLIDLLSQEVLKIDLSHIKAEEIIMGNPEMCIELLQIIYKVSEMLGDEEMDEGELDDDEMA